MEFVVADRHGRPICLVEAANIGAANLAVMRLPSGRAFDGTIRPRAEVEPQIAAHEARRVERAKATFGRLGVGEAIAIQGFSESRRSGLDTLPRYRIPSGGLPARWATPSSSQTQAAELRERTRGRTTAPSAQTVELRERAAKTWARLGIGEAAATRGF